MKAALLLILFLAAGSSIPGLDALLYHGLGSEVQQAQSHLEPTGGCLEHDQHCGLGRTAPGSGAAAPTSDALIELEPLSSSPVIPSQARWSTPPAVLPRPRAPPASRV